MKPELELPVITPEKERLVPPLPTVKVLLPRAIAEVLVDVPERSPTVMFPDVPLMLKALAALELIIKAVVVGSVAVLESVIEPAETVVEPE